MSDILIHERSGTRRLPVCPVRCGLERTSTNATDRTHSFGWKGWQSAPAHVIRSLFCMGILVFLLIPFFAGQGLAQSRLGGGAASGAQGTGKAPRASRMTVLDLPPGLERLSPSGTGLPVLLVPGLFLSGRLFQHGPDGGLAMALERAGFEVWTWTPWTQSSTTLSALAAESAAVVDAVQGRTGKSVRWVGMELGALLGLQAASEGAPLTLVAAVAPRLELAPCSSPLERALRAVQAADSGTLTSVASSLWSRGDVPYDTLEQVLLQDMVSLSPALATHLLDVCTGRGDAHLEGPAWERLWLPVGFFASSRDGQAPLELLLDHADAAPAEYRFLRVLSGPHAPSHLGVLLGAQAPGQVYAPLVRFLRAPGPDKAKSMPMVPVELRNAARKGGRR